jgi:uncharacterized protein with GYD domain
MRVGWSMMAGQHSEGAMVMAMYLTKFSHTPETWAKLLANPEDRRTVLSPVFDAMGGKLHGYWYAFGDDDGFVLFEAPDDVTAGSLLVRVASTGAFTKVSTTKLLTVDEALEVMRRGGATEYRPPGAPGS